MEAAAYAKKIKPKSKICLVVPDLPQYMNLNEGGRGLYDFFKKYDIRYMERLIERVDSFVLLTEPMKDVLKVGGRPYIVTEGIADIDFVQTKPTAPDDGLKRIVYTGKMNVKFGIRELVDSFMKLEDPAFRLILCGDGDARPYVEEKAASDPRIEYKGMVSSAQAKEYILTADVLVNPRPNNEEYTKYSFPSKNIEYLVTGNPVAAYLLDGIPENYRDFLYVIPPEGSSFDSVLLSASRRAHEKSDFRFYASEYLCADVVVRRILDLFSKS